MCPPLLQDGKQPLRQSAYQYLHDKDVEMVTSHRISDMSKLTHEALDMDAIAYFLNCQQEGLPTSCLVEVVEDYSVNNQRIVVSFKDKDKVRRGGGGGGYGSGYE